MAVLDRLNRLQAALRTSQLDALVVTSAAHIRYLTGASGPSLMLVVTPSDVVVLTHFLDLTQTDAQVRSIRLRRYEDRLTGLAEMLEQWSPRRIGFEARSVVTDEFLQWCERLPDAHLIPADAVLDGLRSQVDPDELASIQHAAVLADQALASVGRRLSAGLAEVYLAAELTRDLLISGAERLASLLVQFGLSSAQPQARPGTRRLAAGDLVVLSLAPIVDGCRSSLSRTGVFGTASAEQRQLHATVTAAQRAALAQIRPGVTGAQIDQAARQIIDQADLERYFGHAVGSTLQGSRLLGPNSDLVLEAGMILTIGPGIYIPGWGGLRVEDTVVVSEQGSTVLSRCPSDLQEWPAG